MPGYPHPESAAKVLELHSAFQSGLNKASNFFALLGFAMAAGLGWVAQQGVLTWVYAIAVGFGTKLICSVVGFRLSRREYYAIPFSAEAGEHRCIHCGHHGIWRKGVYRSSTVLAHCSNCSGYLFSE